MFKQSAAIGALTVTALVTGGWGPRGHVTANRMAVDALPAGGPTFLKEHREWIGQTGPVPDSWRALTEPYSKLVEDPNHGWFKEQFAFMREIPRSRYEFMLRLYDEYLRIKDKEPERAKLTNVRWTGTLPYAAIENFDRMKAAMRLYRRAASGEQGSEENRATAKFLVQDIAFYMGWLGHYTADGAMPLHDSVHHDGWHGSNPKGYTTDPSIHGRFESTFVDLIELAEADLKPLVGEARVLEDPFAAILDHLDDASTHVIEVYEMDKRGAFGNKDDQAARRLVYSQLAKAAALLRDLTHTAWVQSGQPPAAVASGSQNSPRNPVSPLSPRNPSYHGDTGTASPGPAVKRNK